MGATDNLVRTVGIRLLILLRLNPTDRFGEAEPRRGRYPDRRLRAVRVVEGAKVVCGHFCQSGAMERWANHSLGLFPATRRNSRLKFDFVLKPDESIADVTFSPPFNAACAAAMRAVFT